MRHLAGILVLLVLAGIAIFVGRSMWLAQRRQRRATRRGMRIRISEDSAADRPADIKED